MQSNYIARLFDGRLIALYHNESGIMARVCENGRWLPAGALLKGAQPAFSASFSLSGQLQIYAQDEKGSVVLISFDGENISLRTILENRSREIHAIFFNPIGRGGRMCLLYNIPDEDGRRKLIIQKLNESGIWDKPEEIAVFAPQGDNIFEILHIGENHALVFYRQEGNISGYREITPERVGEFVPFARAGENIHSYGFFPWGDSLHMVYLSSNLFSSRLVYRRKVSDNFEPGVLLWEGQWLDNCLICEINGELCVFFQSGGSLYMTKSADKGSSFSRPEIYAHKFCRLPKKAIYISEYTHGCYDACHVFVDSAHPWDIQILPDLCADFYSYYEGKPEVDSSPVSEPPSDDEKLRLELIQERLEKLASQNERYRAQLEDMAQKVAEYEQREKKEAQLSAKLAEAMTEIENKEAKITELLKKADGFIKEPSEAEEVIDEIGPLEASDNINIAESGVD